MSQSKTIDIPVQVREELRKFRFSRLEGISVLIVKINKQKVAHTLRRLCLEVDERLENISVEELADELPENAPRYVVISYPLKHADGRLAVPLAMINWKPTTSSPEMNTLHASGLSMFQQVAQVSRIVEVRDGAEALTEDYLNKSLG
ncbi:Glia maturation factor beta [Wallemia ichthyophaga EXF-994]|uniref:Glia maturation factor beta n=1 Tax=Wallemia ichthyophaga (strain EXF-994 / CBS 113033) TaxID=1299270 RepID=R9AAC0_WALI9|nr:Glia maturation factor beta [Wallemia ichthyophaga EXF-994]EOQ99163.1 Glia maturation factor beta [Wallemia ichthyophaga EXF-994]